MTAKYMLPCSCGRQIAVEPRQAGQTMPCSCGATLQVPTLLDMTMLEPAPQDPSPTQPPSSWGVAGGLQLLGFVLVTAATALGVFLMVVDRPRSRFDAIDPEQIRTSAQKMPPAQTWEVWQTMKQGLDRRTDQQYVARVGMFRVKLVFTAALAVLGIALFIAGKTISKVGARGQELATSA